MGFLSYLVNLHMNRESYTWVMENGKQKETPKGGTFTFEAPHFSHKGQAAFVLSSPSPLQTTLYTPIINSATDLGPPTPIEPKWAPAPDPIVFPLTFLCQSPFR